MNNLNKQIWPDSFEDLDNFIEEYKIYSNYYIKMISLNKLVNNEFLAKSDQLTIKTFEDFKTKLINTSGGYKTYFDYWIWINKLK